MHDLSPEELARYARQIVLPGVGEAGQARLNARSVALIGAGGLGSPLALYLAAAGVGRIGLIEFDTVDLSNLHRQILYRTEDLGRRKAEIARERILSVNPHVQVDLWPERLEAANAADILGRFDVVADGSDNFATRYLVNDACVLLGKPNVHGSVFRFEGQVSVFDPRVGPCYRCLFPVPPPPDSIPSCAEGGVLGVLPGVIGVLQATEVLKILLGLGETLAGRLLLYDASRMEFRELRVARNPDCPVCGTSPTIHRLEDLDVSCASPPAADPEPSPAEQKTPETIGSAEARSTDLLDPARMEITAAELKAHLDAGESFVLLDVREPFEARICRLVDSRFMPMGQIQERWRDLDPGVPTVVYCHAGVRSFTVARFLKAQGFRSVWSLRGGIDAWAATVDPQVARY
jgi:sulfur-carrier protein adenylyltransferase/sulfurtransferase